MKQGRSHNGLKAGATSKRAAYLRVADDMRQRIIRGTWPEGSRLPTIDELVQHSPVSRMTLVRAVQLLRDQGLVIPRGKGGTWVAPGASKPRIALLSRLNFDTPGHAEFTHRLTKRIHESLVTHNFIPIVCSSTTATNADDTTYKELCDAAKTGTIDGLIDVFTMFPAWHKAQTEPLAVPAIHVGLYPAEHRVFFDTIAAVDTAIKVLGDVGMRTFGLISNLPPQQKKVLAAQNEGTLQTDTQWIIVDHHQTGEEFGFAALHTIWSAPKRPQAIFVSDDVIAQGVAQAALALRVDVPQDLLIACMGNDEIDRFYPCPVLRIDLSLTDLAEATVIKMSDILHGNTRSDTENLIARFTVRPTDIPNLTRFAAITSKVKKAI